MKRTSKKKRTDAEYVALDDAIATLQNWQPEIEAELAKSNVSWKALSDVLSAMERVHSPEE